MFCPDCGLEDKQSNQFCRACGADLRLVRTLREQPDNITASAASARDEIGRAIAAKIRDSKNAAELAVVAGQVLPEVEKFLESPEEKRFRRMRAGMILSCVGLGAAIGLMLAAIAMKEQDMFFMAALGIVTFFIGLGFILNGLFLTSPRKKLTDRSSDAASQRRLDGVNVHTNDLVLPEATNTSLFSSVTEHTTQHLKEKEGLPRD